jgi:hypothetical protein
VNASWFERWSSTPIIYCSVLISSNMVISILNNCYTRRSICNFDDCRLIFFIAWLEPHFGITPFISVDILNNKIILSYIIYCKHSKSIEKYWILGSQSTQSKCLSQYISFISFLKLTYMFNYIDTMTLHLIISAFLFKVYLINEFLAHPSNIYFFQSPYCNIYIFYQYSSLILLKDFRDKSKNHWLACFMGFLINLI